MQFVIVLLIAAAVFGVCYLVDKGFSKAFRGKAQHRSGMAVRANKRFGVFGVVLTVLGVMAFCIGIGDGPVLIVGGLIVFAMGIFLAVYYLSFGIFYDGESFLMSRFGKKDAVHRYEEIVGQKLYVVQGGSIVAELYLKDGSTVSLQSTMDGVYPFQDTAFAGDAAQVAAVPTDGEVAVFNPAGVKACSLQTDGSLFKVAKLRHIVSVSYTHLTLPTTLTV